MIVLEVSEDMNRALIALPSSDKDTPSKIKAVPVDDLELSVSQLCQLRMGVRNDIN